MRLDTISREEQNEDIEQHKRDENPDQIPNGIIQEWKNKSTNEQTDDAQQYIEKEIVDIQVPD